MPSRGRAVPRQIRPAQTQLLKKFPKQIVLNTLLCKLAALPLLPSEVSAILATAYLRSRLVGGGLIAQQGVIHEARPVVT